MNNLCFLFSFLYENEFNITSQEERVIFEIYPFVLKIHYPKIIVH